MQIGIACVLTRGGTRTQMKRIFVMESVATTVKSFNFLILI